MPSPSLGDEARLGAAREVSQATTRVVRLADDRPAEPIGVKKHGSFGPQKATCLDAGIQTPANCSSLSEKLAAAKPVVWRGKGDLPQFPWASPPLRGSWLVLDLWAGYSGLCISLLSMGVHFYALAAETDPACRTCAQETMPNIVHVDAVEHIQARDLRAMLKRRQFRGIIVGGGSPCQGNSVLNLGRGGLADQRSLQPSLLARLVQDLETEEMCQGLSIVAFLENVASMPREVRLQYNQWLRSEPVIINAASCGWVQRRRMFWLSCRGAGLQASLKPPADWDWVPTAEGDVSELAYKGKKPIPSTVTWLDGYYPLLDPTKVMESGGMGAMHTFTREFFHPNDRVRQVSAEAAHRFETDHRRFPPGAYEEHSLVWKQDRWRQLYPEERAQLLGMPPAAVAAIQGPEARRTQGRNSLLGNGFHLPSVLVIFMMLPALLDAKLVMAPSAPDFLLRTRLQGSIWEPQRLDSFPDLLKSTQIVQDMRCCFDDISVPEEVWRDVDRRLSHCRLSHLQGFAAWRRLRGEPWSSLGPFPLTARDRTGIYAGLSGQRYASSSARGLDHLLPPGLGPSGHIAAALQQPSPFRPRPWPEPDVGFLVDTFALWREHLPGLANAQRTILRSVATALRPLEIALQVHRTASAHQVASTKQPAFVSCMTSLLRWHAMARHQAGQTLGDWLPDCG